MDNLGCRLGFQAGAKELFIPHIVIFNGCRGDLSTGVKKLRNGAHHSAHLLRSSRTGGSTTSLLNMPL